MRPPWLLWIMFVVTLACSNGAGTDAADGSGGAGGQGGADGGARCVLIGSCAGGKVCDRGNYACADCTADLSCAPEFGVDTRCIEGTCVRPDGTPATP
jgi:hypothetical protein